LNYILKGCEIISINLTAILDLLKGHGEFISAIVGAIVGSVIGGFFTVKSVKIANANERERNEIARLENTLNFVQAIRVELNCLYDRYQYTIGKRIEDHPPGEAFVSPYIAEEGYFTVFDSNALLVAQFSNAKLSEKIIRVYINAKGMTDTLRMNGELSMLYLNQEFHSGMDPFANAAKANILKTLIIYMNTIREEHKELTKLLPEVDLLLGTEVDSLSARMDVLRRKTLLANVKTGKPREKKP